MVLESLLNPLALKTRPWEMFFAGFIYAVVGLLLSYFSFREHTGLLMVSFIVMAAIPMVYVAIKKEEKLDLKMNSEWRLLQEHSKVIMFLVFLFLGIMSALVLAYVFLPQDTAKTIFNVQEQEIIDVNNNVQGKIITFDIFIKIFLNNMKVLFFCLAFSFLYGFGALFILTWNASVVAAAMGNLIKSKLGAAASVIGFNTLSSYFGVATFGFLRYMTHGVFEVVSYFIAGLAGSIVSIAVIRGNMENKKVIKDTLFLFLISIGVLLFAVIVEVYFTPLFF
ncbi:MAG: stage II sporulation protein M [Nanoarchaeota archaeon]|nr:stage II sporulation protein M [Nanoarchaeota archaeon]MBU1644539.1 stage II sporulation protein M [Nanoarchaeota archaeon]MBU1976832.1 stage II sporulation protein M [Nanoarchaeota archaeon]